MDTSVSIQHILTRIATQLHPLKAQGPFLIHCQWIHPQPRNGASGFFAVTLADCTRSDISIPGFIWDRPVIETLIHNARTFGIDLCDRSNPVEVYLEASIDFWSKQGKVYLRIHKLNNIGMMGLKQRDKEQTLRRLESEQLLTRNQSRPWSIPCLRVALITKQESAACEDILSILRKSGYAFRLTLFHVSVQGIHAASSIVNAFAQISARHTKFDVVILARGGGSDIDLHAFDQYPVVHALAHCPYPVITGLGHSTDQSLCDRVAYRALETPTAAATYIVETVTSLLTTATTLTHHITTRAALTLAHARSIVQQLAAPIVSCSLEQLRLTGKDVSALTIAILHTHSTFILQCTRQRITNLSAHIHARILHTGPNRVRLEVQPLIRQIQHYCQRTLEDARHTTQQTVTQLDALHPDRLATMGFVYVTTAAGTVVHDPTTISRHQPIVIHFPRHDVLVSIVTIKEQDHGSRQSHTQHRHDSALKSPRRTRRTQTDQSGRRKAAETRPTAPPHQTDEFPQISS